VFVALIFTGHTTCPLCGKVLLASQEIVSFPAFLKKTHPLFSYSDAAFHKECFDNSVDHVAVTKLYGRFREILESRPRGLKTLKEIEEWGKSAFAEFE